ncbi:MAG: NADH-quinone oxidoreductase subunit NuoH [Bacteroidetes bacterium]|nr:NADH-quinone oxidoreductase subunit NuoH [Bacteroidota bacterium]
MMFYIGILLRILLMLIPLLIGIAYLTLIERKVIASMQRRKGPNVVGFFGLLQPFADAAKLLIKETLLPSVANRVIFLLAPIVTLFLSLLGWGAMPVGLGQVLGDVNIGILYIFAVSSLGVYGIIISGWSSNSRYAFLGGLRSAAQMVSYEVSIGLIVINVLLCVGSLNLSNIVSFQETVWLGVPLFNIFGLFFISALAETNRPPFDLPEAEAELVAGYFVEYSSMSFALFFIGEYGSILLMSTLTAILFMGGWLPLNTIFFSLKIVFVVFCFVWVRAAFPRYRYDQLMRLGWKVFLPLSLGWVVLVSGLIVGFV